MTPKEIKKLLPYGVIKQVAKELGVSKNTVSRVVNENYPTLRRSDILNALVKKIIQYQQDNHEAEQAMEKVLSNQTPIA